MSQMKNLQFLVKLSLGAICLLLFIIVFSSGYILISEEKSDDTVKFKNHNSEEPSHKIITPNHMETEPKLDEDSDISIFLEEIQTFPHYLFEKLEKDNKADVLMELWEDQIYGGSVLEPIVVSTSGMKREIKNDLRNDIIYLAKS